MGDRSGGREAKGSQLKKSKKNPGSVAARGKKRVLELPTSGPSSSLPPPRPCFGGLHFDCGAALLSRQFDRDRDRVLQRAQTQGFLEAVVLWFSDVEKQQQLADICKDNFGFCYNVVGVHPDNIQNTNKRRYTSRSILTQLLLPPNRIQNTFKCSHDTWLVKIEDIARRPECLGILSGFNLQKELATHFAQETLLKASCALADRLFLPLVLHVAGDGASLDKAIELLRGEGWTADSVNADTTSIGRRVILHDVITACGGDASKIDAAVQAGFFCSISAAGLTEADEAIQTKARAAVARIPTELMLVCSDSPWRTPQNLPDPYLRTLRNEPSNLPSVVSAIADALTTDTVALAVTLKENAMRVFGMEFLPINDATAAADTETTANSTSNSTAAVDAATATTAKTGKRDAKTTTKAGTQSDSATATGKATGSGISKINGKPGHKPSSGEDDSDNGDNDDDDEAEDSADRDDGVEEKGVGEIKALNTSLGTMKIAEIGQPYFSCQKCRTALFAQSSVLAHGLGAARTVFKVGDEGLCSAALFLSHNSSVASSSSGQKKGKKNKGGDNEENARDDGGIGYAVNGTNVECLHCSTKLGRYSVGEATCPCGAVVPGPAVRITTAKVDFVDGSLDAFQLAERSRLEAAERDLLGDDDEQDDDEQTGTNRKNKKKKKLCSENRGNFSNFRNKSFIPNASRVVKKNVDDDKMQREGQMNKSKRNDDVDDDDDNTDSDDNDQKEEDDEDVVEKRGKGKGKASSKIDVGSPKKGKVASSNSHFGALDSSSDDES